MLRLSPGAAHRRGSRRAALVALSAGQFISWGTLYYGITFIAAPIRQETDWGLARIFGAYSLALLIAAIATPYVGHLIRQHGGRAVMASGSIIASLALLIISSSKDFIAFQCGWLLAGIAMAMTLYEAAFSTLREIDGLHFKRGISFITIVGGLASTLFWPLTAWLVDELGWRLALLVYAAMHLLICFPLHTSLHAKPQGDAIKAHGRSPLASNKRTIVLLAAAFALAAIATAAIASHAQLLMAYKNIPADMAMLALTLIGPMQVAGRMLELGIAHRLDTASIGIIALCTLSCSLALLLYMDNQAWLVFGFAVLYGLSNGVMTVVRGAIVAELFDKHLYATILAAISTPAMLARALGPLLIAMVISAVDMDLALRLLAFLMLLACGLYWYATMANRSRF
ncbi:MAG: MFS transporter [Sideroxydans sp.]|nr:MFS transporter [Sideroxydans sp.]